MTRRSAELRLKGHQLRVKGAIGWSALRRWRFWRAERLLEQADVEDTFARYRSA